MRTYDEIEEKIEKLEKILIEIEEQIKHFGRYSTIGINMSNQYDQIQNNIEILKWVIS